MINHYSLSKKKILNVSDILFLLNERMGERVLKFPFYVDFQLLKEARTLVISMKMYVSTRGTIKYSCAGGMQQDESCFEGWAMALKLYLPEYIDDVILQWDIPSNDELTGLKFSYYNCFLYRVSHFEKMFSWFKVADSNLKAILTFDTIGLELGTGRLADLPDESAGTKEALIALEPRNLQTLKTRFHLLLAGQQLSIDVYNGKRPFFESRQSGIDMWGVDDENRFHLFKVCSETEKIGLVGELLFYCAVMYDTLVCDNIKKLNAAESSESEKALYAMKAIEGIRAYFLFEELPPFVKGVSSLLNGNRYGIEFFNIQYQQREGSPMMMDESRLQYKGGFQLREEYQQSRFRKKASLPGSGFTLQDGKDNLYNEMPEAISYFWENRIPWWNAENPSSRTPSTDMLSSQMQCVNYLFPLYRDKKAALQLAQLFDSSIDDVLPPILPCYGEQYIDFGFVYNNIRLLNEGVKNTLRGGVWTSADACIMARRGEKKILILIEWKYAESYCDSFENSVESTLLRSRYNALMKQSEQLVEFPAPEYGYYYYEPFYKLMRQTLLAEGIVREKVADDYLHVVVAPATNLDLFENNFAFTFENLETTWKHCLRNPDKFVMIDCGRILEEVVSSARPPLAKYLKERY